MRTSDDLRDGACLAGAGGRLTLLVMACGLSQGVDGKKAAEYSRAALPGNAIGRVGNRLLSACTGSAADAAGLPRSVPQIRRASGS
jgi:hypothetical protein